MTAPTRCCSAGPFFHRGHAVGSKVRQTAGRQACGGGYESFDLQRWMAVAFAAVLVVAESSSTASDEDDHWYSGALARHCWRYGPR